MSLSVRAQAELPQSLGTGCRWGQGRVGERRVLPMGAGKIGVVGLDLCVMPVI